VGGELSRAVPAPVARAEESGNEESGNDAGGGEAAGGRNGEHPRPWNRT